MKDHVRRLLIASVILALAAPAVAGEVRLVLRDGRVTLTARGATVREILAEWARVGQTQVINIEKLGGDPVNVEYTDVPEAQVLESLLRSMGGYIAAPRASVTSGVSQYDRVLIFPLPATAAVASGGPVRVGGTGGTDAQPGGARYNAPTDEQLFGPNRPGMGNFPGVGRMPGQMPQRFDVADPNAPIMPGDRMMQPAGQPNLPYGYTGAGPAGTVMGVAGQGNSDVMGSGVQNTSGAAVSPAGSTPGVPTGGQGGATRPGVVVPAPQQKSGVTPSTTNPIRPPGDPKGQ